MANTINNDVDNEWAKFISPDYNDVSSDEDDLSPINTISEPNLLSDNLVEPPKANAIYISTKSKIAYLDREIDLKQIFWKIPVIPYSTPANGVIKKQMKFNSNTQEELAIVQENLQSVICCDEQVMTSINNPNGRIKFKDIRKISIGISKKDIIS